MKERRLGTYNDIGEKAEEQEGEVGSSAPSRIHNLQDGVCLRCFPLHLDSEDAE